MNSTLIAAMIGSITTIISPILVYLIKRKLDENRFKHISKERISALTGIWNDIMIHPSENNRTELRLQITCKIQLRGSKIIGLAEYTYNGVIVAAEMSGWLLDSNYAKLEYWDRNPHIIRHGTVMTKLSSDGTTLKGRMLGYAAEFEDLLTGTFELKKQQ